VVLDFMNLDGGGGTVKRAPRGWLLEARIVLLVVTLAVAGFYLRAASRSYRALRLAEDTTPQSLKAALQLEPSNAEFHYRSGRYSLLAQDFPSAVADFQAAIALNPYDARYWLDLASANLASDDLPGTQRALARAMDVDPTTPEVVWQAANYELVQGNTDQAVRRFHDLVEHDADSLLAVLNVCWRATRDPELIAEKVLPARADSHFTFIRFLGTKHEPEAADKVWRHLIALKQPFPVQLAFPYFDYLLSQGEAARVSEAWEQLATADPDLRAYVPADDQIVNGGFELDLLNGGLDWRYLPKSGVTAIIDINRAHSGKRSLAINFTGAPEDAGVYQFVPVRANTHYEFSGFMMAEDLETVSPPRFSLLGMRENRPYVLSEGVSSSGGWQQLEGEFTTGPEDDLLLLRVVRSPSQRLIRGKVWVDDVKLVAKP
jgi:tetratricopeptide (TPR) repeat protein